MACSPTRSQPWMTAIIQTARAADAQTVRRLTMNQTTKIPYTHGDNVSVVAKPARGGAVSAHIERDGKRVTESVVFATPHAAIDYWFSQYHRGKVRAAKHGVQSDPLPAVDDGNNSNSAGG